VSPREQEHTVTTVTDAPPLTRTDALPDVEVEARQASRDIARCDVPTDLDKMLRMAEVLAGSRVIPRHFQRTEDIVMVMMAARALDVPVFWALQAFHLVEGKLGLEATFMRALLYRAGGAFRLLHTDATKATAQFRRPGETEWSEPVTWTIEQAKTAGLSGKKNWQANAVDMLVARVTGRGMRRYCPDVLMGFLYTPDEIEDGVEVITVTTLPERSARPANPEDVKTQWLRRIAAADLREVAQLYREAEQVKLLDRDLNGKTVRERLTERGDQLNAEANAARAADDAEDGMADVDEEGMEPDDAEGVHPADDSIPALTATREVERMSCGCPTDVVFATGNHDPGCAQYMTPAPAADPRAARRNR
jgi:hypothetical protein